MQYKEFNVICNACNKHLKRNGEDQLSEVRDDGVHAVSTDKNNTVKKPIPMLGIHKAGSQLAKEGKSNIFKGTQSTKLEGNPRIEVVK